MSAPMNAVEAWEFIRRHVIDQESVDVGELEVAAELVTSLVQAAFVGLGALNMQNKATGLIPYALRGRDVMTAALHGEAP